MASLAKTLREAVARLGPIGTARLLARKLVKRQRYTMILREVPKGRTLATFSVSHLDRIAINEEDRRQIIEEADPMLRDENRFFTFPYHLRSIERPWEYDPLENKHWPHRHYTEQKLHAADTPRDVKIVWEINRFVDLPTLGEAAYLTRDARYAKEIEWRLLSWIAENPFAHSINWASALEIGIRIIAWTASLDLLRQAGFSLHENEHIRRSVYEQLRYLSADLSLDKVVPTNHLIGEATGLLVGASFWEYPTAELDRQAAGRILETEIHRQTFSDGVTREASSWYHQFVTGFFDIADRVAARAAEPMSDSYRARLSGMKCYAEALTVNGDLVRYGDADDGLPVKLKGDYEPWLSAVFGASVTGAAPVVEFFGVSKQAAVRVEKSFLFMRGGEFGMGGAGFSSHAHDDLLSPILFIDGLSVLTDPGSYVYNGAPEERRTYRGAEAHNGLVIGETTGAVQRMNFGWHLDRPDATLEVIESGGERAVVHGSYGEWPWHQRIVHMERSTATISDVFDRDDARRAHWRFHLHPRWQPVQPSQPEFHFEDTEGNRLEVVCTGSFETMKLEHYDYSPSYRVKERAFALELTAPIREGRYRIHFAVIRRSA